MLSGQSPQCQGEASRLSAPLVCRYFLGVPILGSGQLFSLSLCVSSETSFFSVPASCVVSKCNDFLLSLPLLPMLPVIILPFQLCPSSCQQNMSSDAYEA